MTDSTTWLAARGYGNWTKQPLAGDASNRRYDRLTYGPDSLILMSDADAQTMARFLSLTEHLRAGGLCAPQTITADVPSGFALIEDLGRETLRTHLDHRPGEEADIYAAVPDLLAAIARLPVPQGLDHLDAARGAAMIEPLQTYAPGADLSPLKKALHRALEPFDATPTVLCLRDFHAENLIWRPGRSGNDRFGLLDYQDAVAGHLAYDLASLLSDCRRDVSAPAAEATLARMAQLTGQEDDDLRAAVAAWSVQRNLRILGIFARLAATGKRTYLTLMPRVWGHLQRDLSHPALAEVRAAAQTIPAPEDHHDP